VGVAELIADEVLMGVVNAVVDAVADAVVDGMTADDRIEREALSLAVVFSEAEGEIVAVLGTPDDEVEAWDSEAGMLRDPLDETAKLDDTPVPTEVPEDSVDDGIKPDDAAVPVERVKIGRALDDADNVELCVAVGVGAEMLPLAETDCEGKRPEDCRLEENSEATLDIMLLNCDVGRGSGIEAVGKAEFVTAEERAELALDARLDTMLGSADPDSGRSESADERRLERSEMAVEARGGRMPEAEGEAVIVGCAAVGLATPELGTMPDGSALSEGSTPVTSDTTEDRIEDRLRRPELSEDPSEVGIAPDADGVVVGAVPKAVVMPTTMPLEEGVG
jgi:hypothetical protein